MIQPLTNVVHTPEVTKHQFQMSTEITLTCEYQMFIKQPIVTLSLNEKQT